MRFRRLFLALPALGLPLLTPAGALAQRVATGDPALLRALDGTVAASSPMLRTSADPVLGVVVHTRDAAALRRAGVTVEAVFDGFVTARVRASDVARVSKLPGVSRLAMGDDEYLHNDLAGFLVGAQSLHEGLLGGTSYRGAGAIVCVFDSGIDYKHLDFRSIADPTKSRVLRLYDMTLTEDRWRDDATGPRLDLHDGRRVHERSAQRRDRRHARRASSARPTPTATARTCSGTAASNGGALDAPRVRRHGPRRRHRLRQGRGRHVLADQHPQRHQVLRRGGDRRRQADGDEHEPRLRQRAARRAGQQERRRRPDLRQGGPRHRAVGRQLGRQPDPPQRDTCAGRLDNVHLHRSGWHRRRPRFRRRYVVAGPQSRPLASPRRTAP